MPSGVIPEDINAAGDITGTWLEEGTPPVTHGFVIRNGVFASFDVPGTTKMHAYGGNPQGDIVGWYGTTDAGGNELDRPFIRRADGTILMDFEGPEPDIAWWGFTDINARGDIVIRRGGWRDLHPDRRLHRDPDRELTVVLVRCPRGRRHGDPSQPDAEGLPLSGQAASCRPGVTVPP